MDKDLFDDILNEVEVHKLFTPTFWDGAIKEVTKFHSISFCTTCMGRLDDLAQTLPVNIESNKQYGGDLEFVILNYNSNDNLDTWMLNSMQEFIDSGEVTYYKTIEPKYYSMSHSRNIAFKVARGDIVNNIDADNFTNAGFAEHINLLANQQPEKAIFAKGKRMLRGRLGFYKKEFIDLLGGYSEDITGYGTEDHDLMYRAFALGFKMMWYGGTYFNSTKSKKHQIANYFNKDWKYTEKRNKVISLFNIYYKRYKANSGIEWGKAHLIKNFKEEIDI